MIQNRTKRKKRSSETSYGLYNF